MQNTYSMPPASRFLISTLVAAPWLLAAVMQPEWLLLWLFGAVVGELWLALGRVNFDIGSGTAVLSVVGVALGLLAPWALLGFLLPLCLLECHLLLFLTRVQQREARTARQGAWAEDQTPRFTLQLFQETAQAVNAQGYPDVTWRDVNAVHDAMQGGAKPTEPVAQVIAWTLWYQLYAEDEDQSD